MSSPRGPFREIAHRCYSSVFMLADANEDERTQLLNTTATFQTTCFEKLWVLMLGLILVVGVSASTYLLIVQGRSSVPESFTLVPRTEWGPRPSCMEKSHIQLPVQRVLLLPTNTSECSDESDCLKVLNKLQKEHVERTNETDVSFNFVLGGDDRIYEGRGWNCSSSDASNGTKVLTVAFFGTYDDRSPTGKQVETLEAFLKYAVIENRLAICYQILSQDPTTRYITDVALRLESKREKNTC